MLEIFQTIEERKIPWLTRKLIVFVRAATALARQLKQVLARSQTLYDPLPIYGFLSVLHGTDFVMGVIDSPLQLSLKKLLLYFSIPYIVFLGPQISCVQYYIM